MDSLTIRKAIDYTADRDEIPVYSGAYTGSGGRAEVNMNGKEIYLRSYSSTESTVIDGEFARQCIHCSGEGPGAILDLNQ